MKHSSDRYAGNILQRVGYFVAGLDPGGQCLTALGRHLVVCGGGELAAGQGMQQSCVAK